MLMKTDFKVNHITHTQRKMQNKNIAYTVFSTRTETKKHITEVYDNT